mmetsp:Transcript_7563/g.22954  ORF Transcript_7563/g.22954 Transcript_7563/m.22954 type:complete len:205 (+) Transcript_7563:1308-1922(+)
MSASGPIAFINPDTSSSLAALSTADKTFSFFSSFSSFLASSPSSFFFPSSLSRNMRGSASGLFLIFSILSCSCSSFLFSASNCARSYASFARSASMANSCALVRLSWAIFCLSSALIVLFPPSEALLSPAFSFSSFLSLSPTSFSFCGSPRLDASSIAIRSPTLLRSTLAMLRLDPRTTIPLQRPFVPTIGEHPGTNPTPAIVE